MKCFFHKWNGCWCEKCGKTRKVRKERDHSFLGGCKCTKCGYVRDYAHSYKCGKCIVCGALDPKKGHGDRRNWGYRMNGGNVDFYCLDCGFVMKTVDYATQVRETEREIDNADRAGCVAPFAENLLEWLRSVEPK